MIKHLLITSLFILQLGCEVELASCVRASDCQAQEQCINGLCYPEGIDASVGSSPCDECLAGWTCDEGRCVIGCTLAACPPGLNCDPATDLCVSTPICLAAEDCSTATDDDCDELIACADPDCAGQTCDDGIWCNGEDQCADGVCAAAGVARCEEEGTCNEDTESCGECATNPDCGADEVGAWGSCSYDGTCDASGTRTRMVTRHQCVDSMCVMSNTQEPDTAACTRNTQGTSCGTNQSCSEGSCVANCSTESVSRSNTRCTGEFVTWHQFHFGRDDGSSANQRECQAQCTDWAEGRGLSDWCCELAEDGTTGRSWSCTVRRGGGTTGSSHPDSDGSYVGFGSCG